MDQVPATSENLPPLAQMSFPFICFHGDADTMTDPEGSKLLFEQSQVRFRPSPAGATC